MMASACTTGILAGCGPLGHQIAQVVDGVQKGVVQLGHLGLDVARHGQVGEEHGFVPALFQGTLDQARPRMGRLLAVQLTTMSNSCRTSGNWARAIALPPYSAARVSPRETVLLATTKAAGF